MELEEREGGSPGADEMGQGTIPVLVEWHIQGGEAISTPVSIE